MSSPTEFTIQRIGPADVEALESLLDIFGEAFEDPVTYGSNRPDKAYLQDLLGDSHFIPLVAVRGRQVLGGLAAYELRKFEQARSEIYIYDLAVSLAARREGVATALINELRVIAKDRRAYVVFVQADVDDEPAINLYTKLGTREDVLHFDIDVDTKDGAS